MTKTPLPFWKGHVKTVETKNGTLQIGHTADGKVVCSQPSGRLDLAQATEMTKISQLCINRNRAISIFGDFRAVDGYDTAARKHLTQWANDAGDGLISLHVLSSNRIVNMGVSVASMVVRPLIAHQKLSDFLDALKAKGGEVQE